jgi:hypothetical protein
MSRGLRLVLILCACGVVLVAGLLWALPEIVRRVALDQIPKRTGRAAAIEDIDINLFTGHVAIKGFRLAERERPEAFVEFERLDVRVALPALLRRSPLVSLSLRSVPSHADLVALRGEAVTARLRDFQKERGLADATAALAEYYKERLPDVAPPSTVEEQLALLGEREPVPDDLVAELSRRRLEATRERLVQAEGISPERLRVEDPPDGAASPDAATTGEGQVEFDIAAGGE